MKTRFPLVLLLSFAIAAFGDHLPTSLLNHGKPETALAGIDLRTVTLDEVLRTYGPPTKTVNVPNNPDWTGYVWQLDGVRLEVESSHSAHKTSIDRISIVRTAPDDAAPPKFASTGAGLKLGDTLDALRRIYGNRFQLSKQSNVPADTGPFQSVPGSKMVMIQWTPMEFTLLAGLDDHGRIIALRLSLPECYPDGCH
jgi:hypothetical protein